MTFQELIETCQDLKISASLIGGAVKMPPRLSLDIYQAVRTHKMAVIEYLEDIRSRRTPGMPQEAPVLADVGLPQKRPQLFSLRSLWRRFGQWRQIAQNISGCRIRRISMLS